MAQQKIKISAYNLSATMQDKLTALHTATDGSAGVYVGGDSRHVHHNTLKALQRRGLIAYSTPRNSVDHWYDVALTADGVQVAGMLDTCITDTSIRNGSERDLRPLRVNLDTAKATQRRAHQYAERLKDERKLTPTLARALCLIQDLERGRVDTFVQMYQHLMPALADVICETPTLAVELQRAMQDMHAQQQQQLRQIVADELERVGGFQRAERPQQPDTAPAQRPHRAPMPSVETDDIDGDAITANLLKSIQF